MKLKCMLTATHGFLYNVTCDNISKLRHVTIYKLNSDKLLCLYETNQPKYRIHTKIAEISFENEKKK